MHNTRALRNNENNTSHHGDDHFAPNRVEQALSNHPGFKDPHSHPLKEKTLNEDNIPDLFDFQVKPISFNEQKENVYTSRNSKSHDCQVIVGESKMNQPFVQPEVQLQQKIYQEILNESSDFKLAPMRQANQQLPKLDYSPEVNANPFENCLARPQSNLILTNPQLAEEIQEIEAMMLSLRNDLKENEEKTAHYNFELQSCEEKYQQEKALLLSLSQEHEKGADQTKMAEIEQLRELKSKLKALRAEVTSVKGELISIDERIKEIEHISLSKEEEIKAEYDSQINDLEQALESIHKQKLAIHNKLMEESASYDIRLEQKAMLKEDLNARLLQRAEIVGQREELDAVLEHTKECSSLVMNSFEEERLVKEQLNKISKQINNENQERRALFTKSEKLNSELGILNDSLYQQEKQHHAILKEIKDREALAKSQIDELFSKLPGDAELNSQEGFEGLVKEVVCEYKSWVQKEIFKNQYELVLAEEKKLTEAFEEEMRELKSKIQNPQNETDSSNLQIVEEKIHQLKAQHILRRNAIKLWKEQVMTKLEGHNNVGFNAEEISSKLVSLLKGKGNFPTEDEGLLSKLVEDYLAIIMAQEAFCCEKRQEEYATLQSKQSLEKRIQQFANQRQELESEISQKEQEFSRLLGAKKELEQQAIVIKNALEEHVIEEANMAFADYLNNQAENFVAIAECYGEEAVEKLKQEQFNEFVEITRKNQRKKIESIKSLQDELDGIDNEIKSNIKIVDEELLPSLNGLLKQIAESRPSIKALKKQQISLLETEDEVASHLNNLQDIKQQRIENMRSKLPAKFGSHNLEELKAQQKSLILRSKELNEEYNATETRVIELDATLLGSTSKHDNDRLLEIRLKLQQLEGDFNAKREEHRKALALEKAAKRTILQKIDELEIKKYSLEQQFVEETFLNNPEDNISQLERQTQDFSVITADKSHVIKPSDSQLLCSEKLSPEHFLQDYKELPQETKNHCDIQAPKVSSPHAFGGKLSQPNQGRNSGIQAKYGSVTERFREPGSKSEGNHHPTVTKTFKAYFEADEGKNQHQEARILTGSFKGKAEVQPHKTNAVDRSKKVVSQGPGRHGHKGVVSPSSQFKALLSAKLLKEKKSEEKMTSISQDIPIQPLAELKRISNVSDFNNDSILEAKLEAEVQELEQKLNKKKEIAFGGSEKNFAKILKSLSLEDSLKNNKTHKAESRPATHMKTFDAKSHLPGKLTSARQQIEPMTLRTKRSDEAPQDGEKTKRSTSRTGKRSLSVGILEPQIVPLNNDPKFEETAPVTYHKHKKSGGTDTLQGFLENADMRVKEYSTSFKSVREGGSLIQQVRGLQSECLFFKKFTSFQSSKVAAFDPLTSDQYPPEVSGYGIRSLKLSADFEKVEIRQAFKSAVETSILIKDLKRIIIPQSTQEVLKAQRRGAEGDNFQNSCEKITTKPREKGYQQQKGLQDNLAKLAKCSYYQFFLILEKGGRIDFIASSYDSFKTWVEGLNSLIASKKPMKKY